MSLILDEHRQYLADGPRVSAFAEAIAETVQPGHVVVDLGSGTGILGMLACRAGAARVYALESTSLVGVAREICRANGFQDRMVFVKEHSTRARLPELADVIVTDQIGRFGFDAGITDIMSDARARFLKPDGAILPKSIDLWIAPVEQPALRANVEFWRGRPGGFDYGPARRIAVNTGYPARLDPAALLGKPVRLGSLDLTADPTRPVHMCARLVAARQGQIDGIGGWFSAALSAHVTMTNSPLAETRINRRNVFLPLDAPPSVEPYDAVSVSLRLIPAEELLSWRVDISRGSRPVAGFRHSTFEGMLLSQEDLVSSRPDRVPVLSAAGLGRRSVLELCDGGHDLTAIEREVFARHRELFRSEREAALFVAEVVMRYCV